jgi:hypothetical protein
MPTWISGGPDSWPSPFVYPKDREETYSFIGSTVTAETNKTETADSLIRKIEQVISDPEMYDQDEERPEISVVQGVQRIIKSARRFLGDHRFPGGAIVRPFDGALRITWITESADVRLSYSKNESNRYIFHEQIVGGRSQNPELVSDVTPSSLAKWLEWLDSQ